jgi:hypothetical protein
MADLVNVSGKVVRVHKHRDTCALPNAIDEVLRINHTDVQPHTHVWLQGTNVRLPDHSWARVNKCRFCKVRVMVMLMPVETRTWESAPAPTNTIKQRGMR